MWVLRRTHCTVYVYWWCDVIDQENGLVSEGLIEPRVWFTSL
ncbi:hypothetical protein GBAR_LOCUS12074, partial [Geodia barretti]